MYYLAVDIGASSGRHILATLKDGKLSMEEIYRFPNGAKNRNGRLYWDVDALFQEIVNGLKKAGEIGKIPAYIGIDTWAVDYVLLDKDDKKVNDVFCYRDRRGGEIKEKAHSVMSFKKLYSLTGIQYQPFNTVYQLYDDQLNGRLERAESMLMLPDYFNFLLTGVKKQEYTNATSTGMVNAKTHTWDEDILKAFKFPAKLFKKLTQPGAVVGNFTEKIKEKIGYDATVLLPATHDTASAVLAAPIENGAPYISSGTWSLLGIEQNTAHTDKKSMGYNYSNEGSINYSFRYQKNIMGLWMIQQVRHELEDKYSFAELADMARDSTHARVVDVNDEKFLAPKSMIAAVKSEVGEMSVGQFAYCIFHSLAKCYAQSIAEIESLTGQKYDILHIIGGGSKNALLNELTAKETSKKIIVGPTEGTAIGNIIMQMIGTGEVENLSAARQIIKNSFTIEEVLI